MTQAVQPTGVPTDRTHAVAPIVDPAAVTQFEGELAFAQPKAADQAGATRVRIADATGAHPALLMGAPLRVLAQAGLDTIEKTNKLPPNARSWSATGSTPSFDQTVDAARRYSSFDAFVAGAPKSINPRDLQRAWNRAHPSVVETTEKGIHIVEIRGGTPYVVARSSSQTFTDAIKAQHSAGSHEVTINMNLYNGIYAFIAADDPANHPAQGEVISGGKQVGGNSSDLTFYVAYRAGTGGAGQDGTWTFGQGNPPADATVAFGGGKPLIVDGLAYGTQNKYSQGAPAGLPQTGDPGATNRQYLIQRSNLGFNDLQRISVGMGIVIIGYNAKTDTVYMVVQPNGHSGGTDLNGLRDLMVRRGVDGALAFDGSTSTTLVRDSNVEEAPVFYKNNSIPFGLTVRTP